MILNKKRRPKKRKLDKKTLAKRKLSRMKKLGYLNAPPRRSAALNASAIMNCMLDKSAFPRPIKIKVEQPDSDDETTNMPFTDTKQEILDSDHQESTQSQEKSCKPNKQPQKLKESSQNKVNGEISMSMCDPENDQMKGEEKMRKESFKDKKNELQKLHG